MRYSFLIVIILYFCVFINCTDTKNENDKKVNLDSKETKERIAFLQNIINKISIRNDKITTFKCKFAFSTKADGNTINTTSEATSDKSNNKMHLWMYDNLNHLDLLKMWQNKNNIVMYVNNLQNKSYWTKENTDSFSLEKYIKGFKADFKDVVQFVQGEILLLKKHKLITELINTPNEDGNIKIFIENDKQKQIILVDEKNYLKVNAIILFSKLKQNDEDYPLLRISYDDYDTIDGFYFPRRAVLFYFPQDTKATVYIETIESNYKPKSSDFKIPKESGYSDFS